MHPPRRHADIPSAESIEVLFEPEAVLVVAHEPAQKETVDVQTETVDEPGVSPGGLDDVDADPLEGNGVAEKLAVLNGLINDGRWVKKIVCTNGHHGLSGAVLRRLINKDHTKGAKWVGPVFLREEVKRLTGEAD